MSEGYWCMSSIAGAPCHTFMYFEVETHCFGRAFTDNILGVIAKRALRHEDFLENLDCLSTSLLFLFQLRNSSNSETFNAIMYFPFKPLLHERPCRLKLWVLGIERLLSCRFAACWGAPRLQLEQGYEMRDEVVCPLCRLTLNIFLLLFLKLVMICGIYLLWKSTMSRSREPW